METRKQITEEEILARLRRGEIGLPPLEVEKVEVLGGTRDTCVDAQITFGWQKKRYRFGAEIRRLWTPKTVAEAANQIQRTAPSQRLSPLVIVPYLDQERLRELEARGISGIDLCGNGIVVVPGEWLVFRTGFPNLYRWEGRIKNVYRGASAMVARAFLLTGGFRSVGEALDKLRALGGEVTLPTVSKVCKSLEQDLVIERARGETPTSRSLRLLQPEKLLHLLCENYSPPEVATSLSGRFAGPPEALVEKLLAWEQRDGRRIVRTGADSVEAYAVMARESVQTFYCSDADAPRKGLGKEFTETERFANVRFLETQDEFVYFDRRSNLLASPVQTYLELATGEKREKETAEQVQRFILGQLSAKEGKGSSSDGRLSAAPFHCRRTHGQIQTEFDRSKE
jgi:hypothetical protein